eukprot:5493731-Ditylum_brightwellii.AAC.1
MQSFNNLSSLNVNSGPNANVSFPNMLSAPSEANLLAALTGAGFGRRGSIGNSSTNGINYSNIPQHLQDAKGIDTSEGQ